MGNSSATYKNGDIPRRSLSILNTSGFAYYSSSEEGVCSTCSAKTRMWLVTSKIEGHFLCDSCHYRKINEARSSNIDSVMKEIESTFKL